MTYAELFENIKNMTEEQLQMNVTVYVQGVDEYYSVEEYKECKETDILDYGHPFITI